jgi:hypothetical protein
MAVGGKGIFDVTMKCDDNMKTTTSQYMCVGFAGGTTTLSRFGQVTGDTGTYAEPTGASNYAIGINQSYLSSGSEDFTVRMLGYSKAVCADSVTAGSFVRAYQGISTTSMIGRIVEVTDRATSSAATMSLCSHTVILGRAMENGQTGSVINVFLNPQLYDNNLVASTT